MAQSGFTPILLYASGTPGNSPSAGNLTSSASGAELAVNYADGKLFYKDSGGSVQTLATKGTGSIGGSTTQVQYNLSGALAGSANLTFDGTTLTANSAAVSTGNLSFSGTAQRITGDFSNGTVANRLMFQASSAGSNSVITAIPNGAATQASFVAAGNSDPTNASIIQMLANGTTDTRIASSIFGTGTYLPMTFYTSNAERMRVDIFGNLGIGTTSPQNKLAVNGNANIGDGTDRTPDANWNGQLNIAGSGYRGGFSLDGTAMWVGHNSSSRALIFAPDETERMRITASGNVGIGTSSPTNTLTVDGNANITGNVTLGDASTDTVQVNGYMGVGGAGASSTGLLVSSSALTTSGQAGIGSNVTFNSSATVNGIGVYAKGSTAAASFTLANGFSYFADNFTKGAGSTITNQHGVYIVDQTQGTNNFGVTSLVSSGTNKWNIYASGTANNYFAGNVLIGGTTVQTFEAGVSPIAQVGGASAASGALSVARYSSGGGATRLMIANSRGAADARSIAQVNDTIGQIIFMGDDGTDLQTPAASILGGVDGTPGANDMPGRLTFSTTADGASTTTERMRIDSSGNLGLGVTPSAWTSARKMFQFGSTGSLGGNNGNMLLGDNYYTDSSPANRYLTNGFASLYQQTSGTHVFYTAPSGTAGNAITFTQAMTLDASGGLLVGFTSNTNYGLTTNHAIAASAGLLVSTGATSGTATALYVGNGGNQAADRGTAISLVSSGTGLGVSGSRTTGRIISASSFAGTQGGYLRFDTENTSGTLTERMRIDSSGNVGIGVTPAYKLDVYSASGDSVAALRSAASGAGLLRLIGPDSTFAAFNAIISTQSSGSEHWYVGGNGVANTLVFKTNGGSERMRIDSSGNVGIGTASPGAKLDVYAASGTVAQYVRVGGSTGTDIAVSYASAGSTLIQNLAYGNGYTYSTSNASVSHVIGTSSNAPVLLNSNNVERMRVAENGNIVQGTAAVATTATAGFLWITSCAGAPTGAPSAPYTNAAAMVVDTTNNRLYVRVGSTWRYATLT